MTNLDKTLACCRVLAAATLEERPKQEVTALIKENLGRGWSLVAAAQYLTGTSALEAYRALPRDFTAAGMSWEEIGALITAAHDFCAKAHPGGPISNGALVPAFTTGSDQSPADQVRRVLGEGKGTGH